MRHKTRPAVAAILAFPLPLSSRVLSCSVNYVLSLFSFSAVPVVANVSENMMSAPAHTQRDFHLHNSFTFWIGRLANLMKDAFNQKLASRHRKKALKGI